MQPVFDSDGAKFDQAALIQPLFNGDPLRDRLVAGLVFDPMPMIGPRALDLDEVVPRAPAAACVSRCAPS